MWLTIDWIKCEVSSNAPSHDVCFEPKSKSSASRRTGPISHIAHIRWKFQHRVENAIGRFFSLKRAPKRRSFPFATIGEARARGVTTRQSCPHHSDRTSHSTSKWKPNAGMGISKWNSHCWRSFLESFDSSRPIGEMPASATRHSRAHFPGNRQTHANRSVISYALWRPLRAVACFLVCVCVCAR